MAVVRTLEIGSGTLGDDMPPETQPRSSNHLQSFERGFQVIKSFSEENATQSLSDVARSAGVSRATARRILLTLEDLGYVRSDGRMFELTARVLELGYAYLATRPVPRIAEPYIDELSRSIGETVVIAVLDDTDIVFAARAQPRRIIMVGLPVGQRIPALHSASGRVMLAGRGDHELRDLWARTDHASGTVKTLTTVPSLIQEMNRVRRRGYAVVDQEAEAGVRTIAVALKDRRGQAVASMSVPTAAGTVTKADLERRILPRLQATARELEDVLAAL